MAKGFTNINGEKYYFRTSGLQMVNNTDDVVIKHLGSNYYALSPEGTFLCNEWCDIPQTPDNSADSNDNNESSDDTEDAVDTYYFDGSGKMLRNCIKELDGDYYMFSKNGTRLHGHHL